MTRSDNPGPADDPSEAPTGQYNYGDYGQQPGPESAPWYRKRSALVGVGVLAAILIGLVTYGVVELTEGVGPTSPAPSSAKLSPITTTPPATTTALPSSETTTEPVAPAPTTTLTSLPTTSAQTTTAPSTTPATSTSINDGHHHHHHHDGGMP